MSQYDTSYTCFKLYSKIGEKIGDNTHNFIYTENMQNTDLSWKNLLIAAGVLLVVIVIFLFYIHGKNVYQKI